jgi:adenine-specific DNA-methyltransferase
MLHNKLQLDWIGKQDRAKLEPRVLLENASLSYHGITASGRESHFDNRLIFGDNLLALKSLEQEFTGRIKCIYIDPPYNTGAAFKHYDDCLEHSLWLSLIRDRVELLYRLLSVDGSIWINLDDNESHYCRVMCDEIFGRRNFVANVVWQKKYTVANDARWLSDNHDHILVYCKDANHWRPRKLPRTEEMNARYKNPDNHPKGPWKATPLHAKSGSETAARFEFTFRNGVTWSPPPGTFPRFSRESLVAMDANDEIWFGKDGRSTPARKTFLSELTTEGVTALTVWTHDEVGHNHEAKEEVKRFNPTDVFSTPKPERLLSRIIHIASEPGDWVLDSFAGSGTTGAVAHKMGRRWIMVELGEHCHTHIIPRLKKVIDGDDPGGVTEATGWQGGGGYRYFRLAPSLMQQDSFGNWVISREYNPAMLAEAICKLEGFRYQPSDSVYWQQGQATENDFIYVTTQSLSREQLTQLSDEVGPTRSLLVMCGAFRTRDLSAFPNLTIKKIPKTVLDKCEWGQDDYSLAIEKLSANHSPEADTADATEPAAAPTRAERKTRNQRNYRSLFETDAR